MFRKQIQKKYITNILSLFLLGIIVSSSFFAFVEPVKAVSKSVFVSRTPSDETLTGNCPTNKLPMFFKYEISKKEGTRGDLADIGTEDEIIVNTTIQPSLGTGTHTPQEDALIKKIQENCIAAVAAGKIKLKLTVNDGQTNGILQHNDEKVAIKIDSTTFGVGFTPFKLKMPAGLNAFNVRFNFEVSNNGAWPETYFYIFAKLLPGKTGNDDTITPLGNGGSGGNSTEKRKLTDIKISTTVKDRYRVLLTEKAGFTAMKFGSNGVGPVSAKWTSPQNNLSLRQEFELPANSDYVGPSLTPVFYNMDFGINYASKVTKNFVGCEHNRFLSDSCKTVYFNSEQGSATSTLGAPSGIFEFLPQNNIDPTINNAAWADKSLWKTNTPTAAAGQPLGTVEFVAIPVIWGTQSLFSANQALSRDLAIAMNANPAKFTIEVYKTEDDIKKACEADAAVTDKTICADPQKMRYSVGKDVTSTTGTTEVGAQTVGQSLYAFIVRVISDIIVWVQSIIYAIFATFLVPILNALLRVRPYQDGFVNIIYPGWLILRNLANIFFIVSLLVVGLRILFQQSAAGTARSFILRLVIMALLVNFSLVIAQGLIGIADTVQSQFLPGNTKIIESLGQKLMVDPLINFRQEVTNASNEAFSTGKAELALADTVKPIVLLMLTIASFFSFVALAAFLLVRLVALWVLYMLSPIAYVGFVMDETKSYASKWWAEFLKYAIVTPVLVFFLNIAALMATVFSGRDNSLFTYFSDSSLSGDIVTGALTIISHFIVLFFIYAGMKFALSSGTAGAKTIVDYSKKGYDALTTRPAKWAANSAKDLAINTPKDFAKDFAKNQYTRHIKDGLLDPLAYRDAYKKKVADTTEEKYTNRILKKDRLTPGSLIEKPGDALKYMYYKASFRGQNRLRSKAERISDEQQIMTQPDRENVENKLKAEEDRLAPMVKIKDLLRSKDPLSVGEGKEVVKAMFDEGVRLEADRDARVAVLNGEADDARDNGNLDLEAAKRAEAAAAQAGYDKQVKAYIDDASKIEAVVDAAVTAGKDDDDALEHLDPQLKEDVSSKLESDIEDLSKEIETLGEKIKDDERRKTEYKSGAMTLPRRAQLEKQKEEVLAKEADRRAPDSAYAKQVRRDAVAKAQKKIEDTDDSEELIEQYNKAMQKNNLPLAEAIAKKLAAEGSFGDLLKDHNYRNNGEDIQKFINKGFEKFSPQVRLQILSEIGSINKKSGNLAGSNLTKIDAKSGKVRMATKSEQASKVNPGLAKKPLSAAKSMKKNEFGLESNDGRLELFSGAAKMLNNFKSLKKPADGADQTEYERKIRTYQQDWAPTAKAILESSNINLVDPDAVKVLKDIATQKINPN